ncbi:radical SAM protein [Aestuariivirga sp.]|uniref:radical SAM protein n=1 Tax=Aestuariivirga sp. TaxID=2650926 RepID=UPI00391C0916
MSAASARHYMTAAAPRTPELHLIAADGARHVFVANGSRLFEIDEDLFAGLDQAIAGEGRVVLPELLSKAGLAGPAAIDDTPLSSPTVHALSLAVAQKCNLGCSYCYAQQGEFGGRPKDMPLATALAAVGMLTDGAPEGARLNLAFMGGEPLTNRAVLRAATLHAEQRGKSRNQTVTFSITTNGTLVEEEDAVFFEEHGFAVSVSLDGTRQSHDALRPYRNGRGSFDAILRRIAPLLAAQERMQVSARVTVTPRNLDLRETLDSLLALGFHSVGFSPMLASPTGRDEMAAADLELMLGEMIDCGREFERRVAMGERYAFANMVSAMREIGRGTHRPYPCGAGAGYLGVSAEGDLSACHRFVGDEAGAMGSLSGGIDAERRAQWLAERHVHLQDPCRSCWARYLCGGGCHHEVIRRGRPACDYIRGWLQYCIEAYLRLPAGAGLS